MGLCPGSDRAVNVVFVVMLSPLTHVGSQRLKQVELTRLWSLFDVVSEVEL